MIFNHFNYWCRCNFFMGLVKTTAKQKIRFIFLTCLQTEL